MSEPKALREASPVFRWLCRKMGHVVGVAQVPHTGWTIASPLLLITSGL